MPEPTTTGTAPATGEGASNGNGGTGEGQGSTTPPSTTAPTVDLKSLPADQLAQVLENPALWNQPRIKELVEAQRKLKKSEEDALAANDAALKEQNKFKELAEKHESTIGELKAKLEQGTINQALTNKLAPLGVVDLEAALALIDRSNVTIDESTGTVKGIDEAIEALKTGKSYLFTSGGSKPTVGGATNQQNGGAADTGQTFKRSQLRDPAFYKEHRDEILKAQAAGRIEDDIS